MSQKIKILFLCPSLQGGGSERFMSILVNNLNIEKFDITLAIIDNESPFYEIDESRVQLLDLKTPFIKHALPKVFRLIWRERPDIVFSNMTKLNIFIATFRPFFPPKTRFMARESSIVSIDNQTAFKNQLKQINFLIRFFYKRFDALVCQSKAMKEDLVVHYGLKSSKITVINNPVNTKAIEDKIETTTEVKTKPRFVSVGRLSASKGFDRLLEAVSILNFDFQFDIIGAGEELKTLQEKAKQLGVADKVHFLGQLVNPFSIIAASDIFIFGSHYEGFPNVLIEAGACGVPIVAFNSLGGTSEIVEVGVNGFLVPDGDIACFSQKIIETLKTPFEKKAIKIYTEKKFGLRKILLEYEKLILSQT